MLILQDQKFNSLQNLKDGSSEDLSALKIDGREFNPEKGDIYKITARFDACDDEKIFGMVAVRYCRYSIGFYSCVCKR